MEKGLWGTDEVPLLGHVVKCGEGVAISPSKVSAMAMATLTPMETVAELGIFLGAAGFLQRHGTKATMIIASLLR